MPAAWPSGTASRCGRAGTPARPRRSRPTAGGRGQDRGRAHRRGREKTGVFTGAYATNPVNGARIPIFVADYVLIGYGTGAIMACPGRTSGTGSSPRSSSCRSSAPSGRRTTSTARRTSARARRSTAPRPTAAWSWTAWASPRPRPRSSRGWRPSGHGRGAITYRLRDWLFSRQRYWGEPFPIVYDETGAAGRAARLDAAGRPCPRSTTSRRARSHADDAGANPETPLSAQREWVEVELDLGDGPKRYTRETNTMPNWAGSCWYELRYLDPHNEKALVDPENERYWMGPRREGDCGGVDLYVGGVEHAVLHLLYARFWHKVLFDLGHVSSFEPYRRLFNQGYIQAYAYRDDRGVVRAGRGGRPSGRALLLRRRGGQPRVRQDGQVAEERGDAGRDVRGVRRRHVPGLRDGDGPAGRLPALGDPGRGRRRSGSCSGSGGWWSTRRPGAPGSPTSRPPTTSRAAAAQGHRRGPRPTWTSCGSTPRSPS